VLTEHGVSKFLGKSNWECLRDWNPEKARQQWYRQDSMGEQTKEVLEIRQEKKRKMETRGKIKEKKGRNKKKKEGKGLSIP